MNPKLTNNQRYNFPTAKQFSHITKSALRIREKAFENPLYSERFKIASNTLLERMNHTNNSLFDGVNKYDIKLGIDKHLTSAMAFRFDNEQHKKFRELYEKGLETQLKLRKTLDELVEIYPFFHESGWLVPDIMAPKYIIHIKNASQADEFMKKIYTMIQTLF